MTTGSSAQRSLAFATSLACMTAVVAAFATATATAAITSFTNAIPATAEASTATAVAAAVCNTVMAIATTATISTAAGALAVAARFLATATCALNTSSIAAAAFDAFVADASAAAFSSPPSATTPTASQSRLRRRHHHFLNPARTLLLSPSTPSQPSHAWSHLDCISVASRLRFDMLRSGIAAKGKVPPLEETLAMVSRTSVCFSADKDGDGVIDATEGCVVIVISKNGEGPKLISKYRPVGMLRPGRPLFSSLLTHSSCHPRPTIGPADYAAS